MTDDNQNQVTPDNQSLFSDDNQDKGEPSFSQEDISKILKQNANAQEHIKNLETETAQFRSQIRELQEELQKAKSIDDLLDGLQQPNDTPGTTSPQIDETQLLNKLKEEVFRDLSAAQQQALEEQNAAEAVRAAQEKFGDGYKSYVQQRAQELDLSLEQIENYARTSPKVFMELLGTPKGQTPSPTTGSLSAPIDSDADIEAKYRRISTLRLMNTPEGIEARRTWENPEFQAQYRRHILEKASEKGSTFGN